MELIGHQFIMPQFVKSSLNKSPNAADINEWTPIHAASAFGFLDIVELLVPLVKDGVLRAVIEGKGKSI